MKVLAIGSDRTVAEGGSHAQERMRRYADALGELHIIVFSLHRHGLAPAHIGNLHIYPTNSFSRTLYLYDAARLARTLPRPDVVTAQDPFESGWAAARIARRFGVPLHLQLHTDPFAPAFKHRSLLNRVRILLMPAVLKRARGIRVVSKRLKESLAKLHLIAPISVLPIFVEVERFAQLQRQPHTRFHTALLWVGRFEREKNPALALYALAAARKKGFNVGLTFLGEGTLKKELYTLAQRLGVGEYVEFPGWQDPLSYMKVADLLLVTSEYEGYGRQIVEALAAKVPVLSTDVGIAREAGAILTTQKDFGQALAEWLINGPRTAMLEHYPYKDLGEYVDAYVEDLKMVH